ncbi:small kinetochore-associated protein-like isoform X3 [Channa argus]|uniref:small kinetochore-associated protein-like isoform X3 n=1 Tax=Channa argus TaxID=215402 RepID=UPI0035228193
MSSKIPRALHLPAEMKKAANKPESKDTGAASATTASSAPKSDCVPKAQKENVPRKNVAPKVHKGISTRYGQQAELKEQNQHLLAANEELQKNLTETQQRVAELELQFSGLEKQNAQVQKNLKDCHVLLVAAEIDPVLGEQVGEAAQHNEQQRREAMREFWLLWRICSISECFLRPAERIKDL